MKSATWAEIWSRRLARHHLLTRAPKDTLIEVVSALAGVHAQVMSSAELALGIRVADITPDDIRDSLWKTRDLVRINGLRGTVHLLPSGEIGHWLAAFRAHDGGRSGWTFEALGLDPNLKQKAVDAIVAALDGRALTKQDLAQELARRTGSWVSQATFPGFGTQLPAWTIALGHAMAEGLICFGPNEGNRVTYVRIEQWLGPIERVEQEEALAGVLRRYLSAYGPANPSDFARWFNLRTNAAKALFARLEDEIEPVDVEGWHAWQLRGDADPLAPAASARLLSSFDPCVVACYPREALVPHDLVDLLGDRGSRLWLRSLKQKEVRNLPVVLIDGKVAGVWQRQKSGKTTRIRVESFEALTRSQREMVECEALRMGEFLGKQVDPSFGRVEVRPHL